MATNEEDVFTSAAPPQCFGVGAQLPLYRSWIQNFKIKKSQGLICKVPEF
jgi:hypothetical protein